MDSEMTELARRAVASPHWRWMPGMLLVCPKSGACYRATNGVPAWDHGIYQAGGISEDWHAASDNVVPGLTDPATIGCLLALVREALGFGVWLEPVALQGQPIRWCVYGIGVVWDSGAHDTREAALVAALEAAPEVER